MPRAEPFEYNLNARYHGVNEARSPNVYFKENVDCNISNYKNQCTSQNLKSIFPNYASSNLSKSSPNVLSSNPYYSKSYCEKPSNGNPSTPNSDIVVGLAVPPSFVNNVLGPPLNQNDCENYTDNISENHPYLPCTSTAAPEKRPIESNKKTEDALFNIFTQSTAIDQFFSAYKSLEKYAPTANNQQLKDISYGQDDMHNMKKELDLKMAKKELILNSLIAEAVKYPSTMNKRSNFALQDLLFVCDVLQKYFFLNQNSVFVNYGGFFRGLLSITISLFTNCVACLEIEIEDFAYHMCAQTILDFYFMLFLDALLSNVSLPNVNVFCHQVDMYNLLDSTSHVCVFDINIPVTLIDSLVNLFNESKTATVFLSFRGDLSEFDIDAEPICQLSLESLENAIIYVKRSAIPNLLQSLWSPQINTVLNTYYFLPIMNSFEKNNSYMLSSKSSDPYGSGMYNNESYVHEMNQTMSPHVYLNIDLLTESIRYAFQSKCSVCGGFINLEANMIEKYLISKSQLAMSSRNLMNSRKMHKVVANPYSNEEVNKYWVCCDKCSKWRYLPNCTPEAYDQLGLRLSWVCSDNIWDYSQASCAAPTLEFDYMEPQVIVDTICWAQCEHCHKWRALPNCNALEYKAIQRKSAWVCSMNRWDPQHANCAAPEQSESDFLQPIDSNKLNFLQPDYKYGLNRFLKNSSSGNNIMNTQNSYMNSYPPNYNPNYHQPPSNYHTNIYSNHCTMSDYSTNPYLNPASNIAKNDISCAAHHSMSSSSRESNASTSCTASVIDTSRAMSQEILKKALDTTLFFPPILIKYLQTFFSSLFFNNKFSNRNVTTFDPNDHTSVALSKIAKYESNFSQINSIDMSLKPVFNFSLIQQTPIIFLIEYLYLKISTWLLETSKVLNNYHSPANSLAGILNNYGKKFKKTQNCKQLELNLDLKWEAESELKTALQNAAKWCSCSHSQKKRMHVPTLHIGQKLIPKDQKSFRNFKHSN